VEKKDGSRTLMVPVIRDAGRLTFSEFLGAFGELIAKARDNKLSADDLTGAIDYPVGLGAIGAMIGAEKVMTMTSTYDHRIIQGAESGRFLALVEELLQGEHGFYDRLFAELGVTLGAPPAAPAPAAAAASAPAPALTPQAAQVDEELLQAVQAATSLLKAHRTHGH